MSIDDRIPELQAAIWKRLGKGAYLRPAGLLEKLGKDLGLHHSDVRRGFIRLKEQGWLDNVAANGEPIGQVRVLASRPSAIESDSLLVWRSALQRSALDRDSQVLLESLHLATDGLSPEMLDRLAAGLGRLRKELSQPTDESAFVISTKYLLGSSKVVGKLPVAPMRQFCPALFAQPDRIPYVVTAGPALPERVVLIENPWAFERAIEAGLAERCALIATFGYGLSRSGEAYGKQLQSLLSGSWADLIQLRRNPEVAELCSLLTHPVIEFWGDFDLEAFRIYRSLLKRLPQLVLSPLYTALRDHLLNGEGHEYHAITAKEGQAPLGGDEFADMPELRKLAELCAVRGLDQEFLSLPEIAVLGTCERS
ncbi:hypothetical protein TUM18999_03170 [Pseudomonas tohonis]|uniref:Wadjet protein JetD C-terminal domain-containing protein n=1 Tax=Pseudomonas tohonis TaxID=2725477 RepID=A0A6J4DYK1_9PSED|nr:hypothetical protein [Pseudomonas tohonis]BCG22126.1 hypothetical protein TUM18999_03170 [Pseudomonas tohonis]